MKHLTRTMLVLTLLATACLASFADGAADPYDQFVRQVAQASELLDRAAYLAIAGLRSYNGEDQMVAIQSLINLFEGADGSNFMSLDTGRTDNEMGLIELYDLLHDANWTQWNTPIPSRHIDLFYDALTIGRQFVETAYTHVLDALDGLGIEADSGGATTPDEFSELLDGARETFRTIYAFIIAARGGFDDPFLIAGIQQVAEIVPSREIWLAEGDNIQTAIDTIPDGGTIHLAAGVYRQAIEVNKSLSILGASSQEISTGATIIEGVEWQGVISIRSDAAISVAIEGITVRGSRTAISVGPAFGADYDLGLAVEFKNVRLEDNEAGLSVYGGAVVRCTDCVFKDNETHAISARVASRIIAQRCHIEGGGSLLGAVRIMEDALVSMEDCSIEDISGFGILLSPTASLHLANSDIRGSYAPAIAIADTGSDLPGPEEAPCGVSLGDGWGIGESSGEITGYGNTIHGVVCPASLEFLTEPEPEGE